MTFQKNSYQAGFTLVELLVVLALSSMLLFGVLQIFDANKHSSRLQRAYAEVQESARIATELMSRDIRMAAFWGCAPDSSAIHNMIDTDPSTGWKPSLDFTNAEGITGVDDETSASATVGTISVKPGTDRFTVKGTRQLRGAKIESPYTSINSAQIHINTGNDIPQGTVLMISDCTSADLFVNTAMNVFTSGSLVHNTGTNKGGDNNDDAAVPDNATKVLSKEYNGSAQIMMPFTRTYFIGKNGDDDWSLYWESDDLVEELVRNVDDLQLLYGEDTTVDGSANVFREADSVGDWSRVVSVKATFSALSSSNVSDSGRFTREYSFSANIRNRTL